MSSGVLGQHAWIRCLFILLGAFLLTSLELYYLEPLAVIPSLPTGLQNLSLLGAVVTYGAVALCASYCPNRISPRLLSGMALGFLAVGISLLLVQSTLEFSLFGVLGGLLINAASAWIRVFSCLCLIELTRKECFSCAGTAMVLFFCARYAITPLGQRFGLIIYIVLTVAMLFVSFRQSIQLFNAQVRFAVTPAVSTAVEPKAFLPFSHKLFVTLFVFSIACGFTVTFSLGNITPASTASAVVLVAFPVVYLVVKRSARIDVIYQMSALFICAGLLAMMLPSMVGTVVPNVLLAAGSNTFKLLAYCTLAIVAQRNPVNALAMLAWGEGIITAAMMLGMTLGDAGMALAATGSGMTFVLIACLVFGFFAYNIVGLHLFSLDAVLQEIIHPLRIGTDVQKAAENLVGNSDNHLEAIARSYNLTPREAEIFGLLVKGRNVPYIESELVISQNTIRSHIKHIYQKTAVHSQQELINLLEEDAPALRRP